MPPSPLAPPTAASVVFRAAAEAWRPPPELTYQTIADAYKLGSRQRAFQLVAKYTLAAVSNPDTLLAVLLDRGIASKLRTRISNPAERSAIKLKLEKL